MTGFEPVKPCSQGRWLKPDCPTPRKSKGPILFRVRAWNFLDAAIPDLRTFPRDSIGARIGHCRPGRYREADMELLFHCYQPRVNESRIKCQLFILAGVARLELAAPGSGIQRQCLYAFTPVLGAGRGDRARTPEGTDV